MRAAGLSKFKKLWGRITDSMPAGNYNVTISNSKIIINKTNTFI